MGNPPGFGPEGRLCCWLGRSGLGAGQHPLLAELLEWHVGHILPVEQHYSTQIHFSGRSGLESRIAAEQLLRDKIPGLSAGLSLGSQLLAVGPRACSPAIPNGRLAQTGTNAATIDYGTYGGANDITYTAEPRNQTASIDDGTTTNRTHEEMGPTRRTTAAPNRQRKRILIPPAPKVAGMGGKWDRAGQRIVRRSCVRDHFEGYPLFSIEAAQAVVDRLPTVAGAILP